MPIVFTAGFGNVAKVQHNNARVVFYAPKNARRAHKVGLWLKPVETVQPITLDDVQTDAARNVINNWQAWKISRFNDARDTIPIIERYVLVVWQDKASEEDKIRLINWANQQAVALNAGVLLVSENNGAVILPAAIAKYRQLFSATLLLQQHKLHHSSVLQHALCVGTVSSWLGFEALLWGKTVHCVAPTFYKNLADDAIINGISSNDSRLLTLVYTVFFLSTTWLEPDFNTPWQPLAALSWLALQREKRERFPPKLYVVGFKYFWRNSVKSFLQGSEIRFVRSILNVPIGCTAVVWGNKPFTLPAGVKLIRLEDGFLRSVGLGALFVKPLSWIADSSGMYFDCHGPSDLEVLLSQQTFSDAMLHRAKCLVEQLRESGVSKYNTGDGTWARPVTGQRCILVPGQVESDASIAYGAPGIKRNIDLLRAVRQNNPDAYIIYKPHPDVLAGARLAGQQEDLAQQYCDAVIEAVDINLVLQQVDEVHVLTSLAGFEALIRGKKVVCYGLPFYAGWGVTQDMLACPRRQRKLTIEHLVAAALISYPLYVSRHSGYYQSAEQTLTDLMAWRKDTKRPSKLKMWLIGKVRKIAGIK